MADTFGAFIAGLPQVSRRALIELRRLIGEKVAKAGDTMTGRLTIAASEEATLADGTGVLQLGADGLSNLGLDGNEIQARSAGGTNTLSLNPHGGDVTIGGTVVVASGSTADGHYVKFYDGTMICWRERHTVTDQAISTAYGSLFIGARAFSFPATFAAAPAVTMGECRYGTGAQWATAYAVGTAGFTARFFDVASRAAGTAMDLSWIAVGRWQ